MGAKIPSNSSVPSQRRYETTTKTCAHVLIYLAYGCLSITGGGVPTALALNTAAHTSSGGHSGCWSRCQGAGAETVEPCSALLHTEGEQQTEVRTKRALEKLKNSWKHLMSSIYSYSEHTQCVTLKQTHTHTYSKQTHTPQHGNTRRISPNFYFSRLLTTPSFTHTHN